MDDITLDRCDSCGHPHESWCDDECCWWKAERFLEGLFGSALWQEVKP